MPISPEERRRFESQVRSLKEAETDDPGTPEYRAEVIAWSNARRAARGLPPLTDEWEDPPELEFYRRAKALGMVRPHR